MRVVDNPTQQKSWRADFARAAEHRRDERRWFSELERKRERQDDRGDHLEDDAADFALGMVTATEIQIAEFSHALDSYDEATVEALMENRERMEEARRKLDDMLAKAHVLPDGRRVFESEDGLHVFDEHGSELSPEVIDPDEIADWRTKWEAYSAGVDQYDRIVEERDEILQFQGELDEAREEVSKGGISEERLDELGDRLAARMPDLVRNEMSGEPQPGLAEATSPRPVLSTAAPALTIPKL